MNTKSRDEFLAHVEQLAAAIKEVRGGAEELTAEQKDALWYSKPTSHIRRISKEPGL
jgi:hypothetical protein